MEFLYYNTRRLCIYEFDVLFNFALSKFLQSVAYQLLIYIVLDSRPLSLYKNVRYEEVEDVSEGLVFENLMS